MAKTKQTDTPITRAADAARAAIEKAKQDNKNKPGPSTVKALMDARKAAEAPLKAERRERFTRVGKIRVTNAIKAIRALAGITTPASYDYTADDFKKITDRLAAECDALTGIYNAAINSPGERAKEDVDFSL